MDNKRFEHLTDTYLRGKAAVSEEAELLQAIQTSKEQELLFRNRSEEWNPLEDAEPDPDIDRQWERISTIIAPPLRPSIAPRRTIWFSIAAAVALLIISGISFYMRKQSPAGRSETDWQTILAQGEDRPFVLPDGSSVYLCEGSELSYPKVFASQRREVSIRGEAFFEVTHRADQPFVVNASGLSVTVLGTAFSVQTADNGNEVSVILVEGKVRLADARQQELGDLYPNQKADYSVKDNHYAVSEVDAERLTSWRKGIISYDNASIEEIVQLIEKNYNITLTYEPAEEKGERYSGAFLKRQKLETILEQTRKLTGIKLTVAQ